MNKKLVLSLLLTFSAGVHAISEVTLQNFTRASTDLVILNQAKSIGELGKISHSRELVPLDQQDIVRMNRDTLYSSLILDLGSCSAKITLPEIGKRFQLMQVISQDHLSPIVKYQPGTYTLTKKNVGSRYSVIAFRTAYNSKVKNDLANVHVAQDAIQIEQDCKGNLSGIPKWDMLSYKKVRDLLNSASVYLGDNTQRMGKTWNDVNPIQHMVGAASSWGLLPPTTARYSIFYPQKNDGEHSYTLTFDAPDINYQDGGFWSITLYNQNGYIEPNDIGTFSFNSNSAVANDDGSYTINFGGDKKAKNFLPIKGMKGWNYSMRLYLPGKSILTNGFSFPQPALEK